MTEDKTPNVLQKIVAHKRQEVEQLKAVKPASEFISKLTCSEKSLYDSLAAPGSQFIFECKKASPSKGLIRETFDLDEILEAYTPFAAGISVLTDEKYFQGNYRYLQKVTSEAPQPVLNKDFFIDEYQVHLARKYNADAILLMLSVLDDQEYKSLAALADHYGLDVLTEVSNEEEALRAVALEARIIGINNRNLRDLSTDLAATEKLVPLIKENAKHEYVLVSESGIYTQADVLRLAPLVDGFLVGSSLMAQADLPLAVKQLLYGTVKVCGITRASDAQVAKNLGASYVGLIFAQRSKRCIDLERAKQITQAVPFNYVGVFVDADIKQVATAAATLTLSAVQLHGNEDAKYVHALRRKLPDTCQIWKAHGVVGELPKRQLKNVDKYLLDCQVGCQSGGTGQSFDWQLLENLKTKTNIALAGGIGPDNVIAARDTGVALLDVNSGVETRPGIKDQELLTKLFSALRQY